MEENLNLKYLKEFEEIIEIMKPVIYSKASLYNISGLDKDDLYQEALIAIYSALKNYDNTKNNNLKAFLSMCIERRYIVLLKKSQTQKNLAFNNYISLDGTSLKNNETFNFLEVLVDNKKHNINEKELKDNLDRLYNILSKTEVKVLDMYIKGFSYKEIANKINKNEKAIDNAIQRIKNKAKTLMLP